MRGDARDRRISAASSAAIFFGAWRSCRASWKAAENGHFAVIALLRLLQGEGQIDAVARLDVVVESLLDFFSMRWNTNYRV